MAYFMEEFRKFQAGFAGCKDRAMYPKWPMVDEELKSKFIVTIPLFFLGLIPSCIPRNGSFFYVKKHLATRILKYDGFLCCGRFRQQIFKFLLGSVD